LLSACKSEKQQIIKEDDFKYSENLIFNLDGNCKDSVVELPPINIGYQIYFDTNYTRYANFNPNNKNEIIYYKQYKDQVLILDRSTGKSRLLTNMHLLSAPKWGSNGWILLNTLDIYKIKSDGTALEKICKGYNPEWNMDGTQFAFSVVDNNLQRDIGVVCHLIDNTMDTLPFRLNAGKCWQNPDDLMVFHTNEMGSVGFNIVDFKLMKRERIYECQSPSVSPCWISNDEFIYVSDMTDQEHDSKIQVMSLKNRSITAIGTLCNNDQIGSFSFSPASNEVIATLIHWKSVGSTEVELTANLLLLNLSTHAIQILPL
jgi:hypothetical protein